MKNQVKLFLGVVAFAVMAFVLMPVAKSQPGNQTLSQIKTEKTTKYPQGTKPNATIFVEQVEGSHTDYKAIQLIK